MSATEVQRVVLLDGGTGSSLVERGHKFIDEDPLWSAAMVRSHPEELVKLHTDFFTAGADVVVTATYQASISGYIKRYSVTEAEAIELLKKGVTLAKTARDEAKKSTGRRGYVAASVGSLGATLCDMSEYHGKYADPLSRGELSEWHLPRLKVLIDSEPDLLAIETIPVVKEAEAILDNLQHFPSTKAWVTFQCKDGSSTAHGEDICDAVRAVSSHDAVCAVGVNCVHPRFIPSLLQQMHGLKLPVPLIVKPNGGKCERDGCPLVDWKLAEHALDWIHQGALWIGGCCHITPSDIADTRMALSADSGLKFLDNNNKLI